MSDKATTPVPKQTAREFLFALEQDLAALDAQDSQTTEEEAGKFMGQICPALIIENYHAQANQTE